MNEKESKPLMFTCATLIRYSHSWNIETDLFVSLETSETWETVTFIKHFWVFLVKQQPRKVRRKIDDHSFREIWRAQPASSFSLLFTHLILRVVTTDVASCSRGRWTLFSPALSLICPAATATVLCSLFGLCTYSASWSQDFCCLELAVTWCIDKFGKCQQLFRSS